MPEADREHWAGLRASKWEAPLEAETRDIVVTTDGRVHVLLATSPWIKSFDGDVRLELEWAQAIEAGVDGELLVLGRQAPMDQGDIRIDGLSVDLESLDTLVHDLGDDDGVIDSTAGPDGTCACSRRPCAASEAGRSAP